MIKPFHPQQSKDDFIFISKLGQGSFGTVYKAKRKRDNELYAIKKIKLTQMKPKSKNNALKQINILAAIQSPNIIKYKDAFFKNQTGQLYMVMQLAQGGDLCQKIKQKQKRDLFFYEYQIWKIGKDILQGIKVLHDNKILHRDIKPANIFFSQHGVAKLGDMNVSTIIQDKLAYTQTGTPYYSSPQVWNNEPYSFQTDIWSFGCLLYQMCCLNQPFKGKSMDQIFMKIKRCRYQKMPKRYSPQLSLIIAKCLCVKQKRAKISDLITIFDKNTPPKSNQNQSNYKSEKRIRLPDKFQKFHDDLSIQQFLPNPNYESKIQTKSKFEQNLNIQDTQVYTDATKACLLDKFIKIIPSLSKDKQMKYQRRSFIKNQKNSKNCNSLKEIKNQEKDQKQELKVRNCSSHQLPKDKESAIPSFKQIISYLNPQKNSIKRFDKYAIDRLNLKRRKLRIAMNY